MDTPVASAFLEESAVITNQAWRRICHCLDQLSDEDIWWTPGDGGNCIGIIIQHLLGNLRQWIISGIGGEVDIRQRPREFRIEERTSKADLEAQFGAMVSAVCATFSRVPPEQLLDARRIQGFDETMLSAIYGTMTHLELHAGQITMLTRQRLGSTYVEFWKPANMEQGA